MNTNLLTSEASVRLGSFNQPLKITKIKSRKESVEEIASYDNDRPSVHSKMPLVEKAKNIVFLLQLGNVETEWKILKACPQAKEMKLFIKNKK